MRMRTPGMKPLVQALRVPLLTFFPARSRFMNRLVLLCWLAVMTARAQDSGAGDSGSGGSTITPGGSQTTPGGISPLPSGTGATPPSGNSALGAGVLSGATPAAQTPPPSFVLPGGSGFTSQTLTGGEGRFAKPRYGFSFSLSQGYDDNIFNTPSHPVEQPKQTVTTLVPERQRVFVGFVSIGGILVPRFQTVTVNVPKTTFVEPPQPAEQKGSAVTNVRATFQSQSLTPRTAYTLDLTAGALYYWSRPGRETDYNGSLGLSYLHKVNARTTVSAQVDAVYQSQPDFSRINGPTTQTANNFLSTNAKADLSHQFSPRIASVSSYTFNGTMYPGQQVSSSEIYENGLGEQLRYLLSARTTAAAELRVSESTHPNEPLSDATNTFLLIGADVAVSQRLRGTFRIGEEIRTQAEGEKKSLATPYIETSTSYGFARGSSVQWSNRFGFEESGSFTQKRLTYRTNLGINYVFSPRLVSNIGISYNRTSTSAISGDSMSLIDNQIQGNAGLQYVMTRTLSLNLNYTYTQIISNQKGADYRRNQVFLGGTYSF